MTSKSKRIKRHHESTNPTMTYRNDRIKEFEHLIAPSEKFARFYHDLFDTKSRSEEQVDEDEKMKIVNQLIRNCGLDNDPLKYWLDYLDYLQRDGLEKRGVYLESSFMILKRCSIALFRHPKYKSDSRFIRILVIYAEQEKTLTESLFWYYYKQNVGVESAVFWISFAFLLEKFYDYKCASCIYKKALDVDAKPSNLIVKRYQDFQQRVKYYGIDIEHSKFEDLLDHIEVANPFHYNYPDSSDLHSGQQEDDIDKQHDVNHKLCSTYTHTGHEEEVKYTNHNSQQIGAFEIYQDSENDKAVSPKQKQFSLSLLPTRNQNRKPLVCLSSYYSALSYDSIF